MLGKFSSNPFVAPITGNWEVVARHTYSSGAKAVLWAKVTPIVVTGTETDGYTVAGNKLAISPATGTTWPTATLTAARNRRIVQVDFAITIDQPSAYSADELRFTLYPFIDYAYSVWNNMYYASTLCSAYQPTEATEYATLLGTNFPFKYMQYGGMGEAVSGSFAYSSGTPRLEGYNTSITYYAVSNLTSPVGNPTNNQYASIFSAGTLTRYNRFEGIYTSLEAAMELVPIPMHVAFNPATKSMAQVILPEGGDTWLSFSTVNKFEKVLNANSISCLMQVSDRNLGAETWRPVFRFGINNTNYDISFEHLLKNSSAWEVQSSTYPGGSGIEGAPTISTSVSSVTLDDYGTNTSSTVTITTNGTLSIKDNYNKEAVSVSLDGNSLTIQAEDITTNKASSVSTNIEIVTTKGAYTTSAVVAVVVNKIGQVAAFRSNGGAPWVDGGTFNYPTGYINREAIFTGHTITNTWSTIEPVDVAGNPKIYSNFSLRCEGLNGNNATPVIKMTAAKSGLYYCKFTRYSTTLKPKSILICFAYPLVLEDTFNLPSAIVVEERKSTNAVISLHENMDATKSISYTVGGYDSSKFTATLTKEGTSINLAVTGVSASTSSLPLTLVYNGTTFSNVSIPVTVSARQVIASPVAFADTSYTIEGKLTITIPIINGVTPTIAANPNYSMAIEGTNAVFNFNSYDTFTVGVITRQEGANYEPTTQTLTFIVNPPIAIGCLHEHDCSAIEAQLQNRIDAIGQELSDSTSALVEATTRLTTATNALTEANATLQVKQEALQQAEQAKAQAEQAKAQAEQAKAQAEQAKAQAEAKLAEAEQAKANAITTAEQANAAKAEAEAKAAQAEAALAEAEAIKNSAIASAVSAQTAKEAAIREKELAEASRDAAAKAKEQAEAQAALNKAEAIAKAKELEQANANIALKQAEIESLQQQLAAGGISAELASKLQGQINQKQEELSDLRAQYEDLVAKNASLQSDLDRSNEALSTARKNYSDALQEIETLKRQLANAMETAKQEVIKDAAKKLQEAEEQAKAEQAKQEAIKAEQERLEREELEKLLQKQQQLSEVKFRLLELPTSDTPSAGNVTYTSCPVMDSIPTGDFNAIYYVSNRRTTEKSAAFVRGLWSSDHYAATYNTAYITTLSRSATLYMPQDGSLVAGRAAATPKVSVSIPTKVTPGSTFSITTSAYALGGGLSLYSFHAVAQVFGVGIAPNNKGLGYFTQQAAIAATASAGGGQAGLSTGQIVRRGRSAMIGTYISFDPATAFKQYIKPSATGINNILAAPGSVSYYSYRNAAYAWSVADVSMGIRLVAPTTNEYNELFACAGLGTIIEDNPGYIPFVASNNQNIDFTRPISINNSILTESEVNPNSGDILHISSSNTMYVKLNNLFPFSYIYVFGALQYGSVYNQASMQFQMPITVAPFVIAIPVQEFTTRVNNKIIPPRSLALPDNTQRVMYKGQEQRIFYKDKQIFPGIWE